MCRIAQGSWAVENVPSAEDDLFGDNETQDRSMIPVRRQRVVLLVDDDVLVRNLARHTLERAGFCVLPAADGVEAVKLLQAHPDNIDIVVTDVDMPRMDGLDLVGNIRREHPQILIVVMSGGLRDAVIIEKLHIPILRKPFLPGQLKDTIEQLISLRQPQADPKTGETDC